MTAAARLPDGRPQTLAEALVVIDALQALVADLRAQQVELQARLAELQARLQQNSSNSSRPPSSDSPTARAQRTRRAPSGRKPGGQPGHALAERPLLPLDQVRQVIPLLPDNCQYCQSPLDGHDPQPWCHQVTDIPKVQAYTDEYQLHTLTCSCCRQTTTASLPPGVPTGAFGPRLQATVAVNGGYYHLSKRHTQQQLQDSYGVAVSLGAISDLEQRASAAVAEPVQQARQYVQQQAAVHLDETGWREGNGPRKAWLWTAVTTWVTVFVIRLSRGAVVAKELVDATFAGVLHSDRWSAYNWLTNSHRQLCWAHLARDFQKWVERGGVAAHLGQRLLDLREQMFEYWHHVRDGTWQRQVFQIKMEWIEREVGALLRQGRDCADAVVRGMCADMLKREAALWTFVRVAGVEPTNNAAEQALRPAVLWRKGSFGTQSAAGSEFVARMLTVVTTCRQQGRNVMDYMTAACEAAWYHRPAPSLVPEASQARAAG
jgi:transposase